jgi:integrase/recombinase XerD
MRRNELARLDRADVDFSRKTTMIRSGKGRKDRVVPLGIRATQWLVWYLTNARPQLKKEDNSDRLFLSKSGRPMSAGVLGNLVRDYVRISGVAMGGGCHLFRHTMATLMLENGADIRYVQSMLGHARLSTTEIYTHVAIPKLTEVHQRCHPACMPSPEPRVETGPAPICPILPDWQI